MPLVASQYLKRPWYLPHAHLETIVPSLLYKVESVNYERERLELPDGDFLDLDWLKGKNKRLMIISHGLEGNSQRHYVMRPAKYFFRKGWDILAWNNRSCSGEMNRLPQFYHHGATEDLAAVIDHTLPNYDQIVMLGSSMGGGMQQKYLGERTIDSKIIGAVSFSVPCNVKDSGDTLRGRGNSFYERRFIGKLKNKILQKMERMELPMTMEEVKNIKTFRDLDTVFTLRVYTEYSSVDDFYQKITSDQYLSNITIPLLIVSAKNDPMLGEKCYPYQIAKESSNIHFETPEYGGHVGFTMPKDKLTYMEYATDRFISEVLGINQ